MSSCPASDAAFAGGVCVEAEGATREALLHLTEGAAIVARGAAAVVFWSAERAGHAALPVGPALNVIDVRGVRPDSAIGLDGAGLLLAGSAEACGAWVAAAGDVPVAVAPLVLVPDDAGRSGGLRALHVLAGPADGPCTGAAERAIGWAAARGIAAGVDGPLGLVARVGGAPALGPGTVMLDLREGLDRLDPGPALAALAAGSPLLFGAASPWRDAVADAGAGWRHENLEAGLAFVAALPAAGFGAAATAALGFVRERHSPAAARAAVRAAVSAARVRHAERSAAWERLGPGTTVLVVSDEAPNLRHVRVHLPFDAMLARGAIAGYAVLHRGEIVFSTTPVTDATRFGAIWVQRSVDPLVQLLLRALGRPFVYDLDDNLLLSPSYRRAFAAESMETARGLIRDCAVLSCATERLAAMLGDVLGKDGRGKSIVTPNLAAGTPGEAAGVARTVVWASSDMPALAGSRAEVERAVRDFCRAHGLRLLCIGATPPAVFAAAGLAVEHVGLLPYPAYLERLRAAAPGILVGPLETGADAATQGFVDGKSDVKVIEARLAGLQGVFSRATPYMDSDLTPAILCDNNYAAWVDGLERARRACERPEAAQAWPARRDAAAAGPMPWAAALRRARTDFSGAEVFAALRLVRAQGETLLTSPALFDEADYLRRHPDVAAAVADGVVESGYRHYAQSGFREGRMARRVATAEGDRSFWWTRLLHEVSALEAGVAARGREIEGLRDRLTVRRLLGEAAPAAAVERVPAAGIDGWVWGDGGDAVSLPCPACDAPGPHAAVLRIEGAALLRCASCGTAFAEDPTVHEYESEEAADVLLQLNLEQNAGIHHQTRLLFAQEGGSSVLDVGCGFGFAVDLAARVLGWRAVGIDPSELARAGAALLGADIRAEYLTPESALGARFDRVIASEVIEHAADPHALLALLRGWLTPGGVLALTTPNARAIEEGADRGRLIGIVAPGVHLTLFTAGSLKAALRRAGFAEIVVEEGADTLVAYASDWTLRADGTAAARHGEAYRAYLEDLVERAAPGSALWNGAAGRLFALLAPGGTLEEVQALFARIAAAWRERFGIDLLRLRLPPVLDAAAVGATDAATLAAGQPLNLAGVLLNRALIEGSVPGHTPETVLAWAQPAYRHAVQTVRVLQAENMIDLDLQQTAWRTRLLIADAVGAMTPELAGEVLLGLAAPGPAWGQPPAEAVLERVAAHFAAAVGEDRFDDARRVEGLLGDAAALAAGLRARPDLLLRTLFTLGVLRLVGDADAAGALAAFERLAAEARRWLDAPGATAVARDFLRLAQEHMAMAAARLS